MKYSEPVTATKGSRATARRASSTEAQARTGLASLAHLIAVGAPTHPDPVPAGFAAYAPAMILLNVRLVAEEACAQILPALVPAATQATAAAAGAVREQFLDATGVLRELRPHRPDDADTMLARHLNPGHALEGLDAAASRRAGQPGGLDPAGGGGSADGLGGRLGCEIGRPAPLRGRGRRNLAGPASGPAA